MATSSESVALPENVQRVLDSFVTAAKDAFQDRLSSIVLFGSGAEGRLRATSDLNVILVLTAFLQSEAERLTPALQLARAAYRLEPMFLLASEVSAAAECFAQKFSDIARRRRVLYGPDPFTGLTVPRSAQIFRLQQVLLNLTLRLRQSYAERAGGLREQLALLVAESAGPLRTCAATLLEIETGAVYPPKEALEKIVNDYHKPEWQTALTHISEARELRVTPEALVPTLFAILEMSGELRRRAERLHESI